MRREELNQKFQKARTLKMGKGLYIVSPRTDCLELREFVEVLASVDRKNTLEKMLPQLFKGREIAVHLEDTRVERDRENSYLLNGRFEANVLAVAEKLDKGFDIKYGIRPISRDGILTRIKHYAVVKKLGR